VLGVKQVGIKDNFFELGGHSLRAMRVMNTLEEGLGKRVELKVIFKNPTPKSLARYIEEVEEEKYEAIPKVQGQEYYPMSSAQKRLFLINQMDNTQLSYNMPIRLTYEGKMDEENIQKVVDKLVTRHEALRTSFHFVDGEAVQKIAEESSIVLEKEEGDEITSPEVYLEEFIRPFNLGKAPLLRVKIVRIDDNKGYLLFDMHHIISDGMSMNIMVRDFCELYEEEELAPLNIQYKDYSQWMINKDLDKQKDYWLDIYKQKPSILDLPLDSERPQIQTFKGDSVKTTLGKKETKELKAFCRKEGYTDYMVLLGGLMVCLSKYSRQEDIIIGSPMSGRTHPDTENIVGMFVNTLAMRGYPEKNKSVKTFLEEIKEHCLEAFENQEYPFEELVENVAENRDLSRNPLFDVMFTFQNNEEVRFKTKDWTLGNISQRPVAKFDLDFNMEYGEESYHLDLTYCKALFKKESGKILLNHYFYVIKELMLNPNKTIGELSLSNEKETLSILKNFNDTEKKYTKRKTVKELFEETVKKNPQKIAVVDGNINLTYQELNNKANHLAKKLRVMGIIPGERVVLLTERNADMMVGIYAVIKAGGAYVPIDPSYPLERQKYVIEDSKPKVVLLGESQVISEDIITTNISIFNLKEEVNDISSDELEKENIERSHKQDDLVYIIYTSGTTGKPKGVMIEHGNLFNYLEYGKKAYAIEEMSVPLFTSIAFDLTVTTLFLPLCTGGKVVIKQDDIEETLTEIFQKDKYNFAKMTPSHLKMAIQENPRQLSNLKTLIVGGEELEMSTTQKALDQFGTDIKIHNEYGPTEATVGCCDYVYLGLDEKGKKTRGSSKGISIGKAIDNAKIYIMNKDKLCSINVPGELCITGSGIGRGYLNKEELTREKFVDNPFGEGKMYRTGDLARWLLNGQLEYLGRIDEQVKIRGYRV
ncbi:non-ribosomal peptide synthetase, partial [Senegalia sp. (in: firmicutes)]|uniref:non-ribosomal peptide synthetase n=1 Tax=Senegalia sp. (in: firmicutes) TaxID=1924098 RepID=UPI003F9E82FC